MAGKLSGGNKRKLSLGIALMGKPSRTACNRGWLNLLSSPDRRHAKHFFSLLQKFTL
jgi:hypothetical protein